MNLDFNIPCKPFGRFSAVVENTVTGETTEIPEQENLILDTLWGQLTHRQSIYCHVGTGSSAPAVTDTSLNNRVASKSANAADTTEVSKSYSAPILTMSCKYKFAFALGAVVGNITELGLALSSSTGLYTRALIKDINGDPTALSLGANDILTVYYTLGWTYDATTTQTYNIDIDGVTTAVTLRMVNYDSSNKAGTVGSYWKEVDGANYLNPFPWMYTPHSANNAFLYAAPLAYNNGINYGWLYDPASTPTLLTQKWKSATFLADGTSTSTRDRDLSWTTAEGNGTWDALLLFSPEQNQLQDGVFLLELSPAFDKTASKAVTVTYNLTFSRGA